MTKHGVSGIIEDIEYRIENNQLVFSLPQGMSSAYFLEWKARNAQAIEQIKKLITKKPKRPYAHRQKKGI